MIKFKNNLKIKALFFASNNFYLSVPITDIECATGGGDHFLLAGINIYL
jgi:hypothetical protein